MNLLAYAALEVWREPLPRVLLREVMDPIGASRTWRWHGYTTSHTTVDGVQIVPRQWIAAARTPTESQTTYGYMNWFLNTPRVGRDGEVTRPWPAAPESAVMFRGAGSNIVYVDRENDLVLCVRWIDNRKMNAIVEHFLDAAID